MRGFSLVELSIVLVILGLLTGGILGGQSLIKAAELRAVSTEYGRYATAIQSFRSKYFAIPGDFADATRFWSRMNSNADCVTNSSAAEVATGVCDGNGNNTFNGAGAASQSGETFQAWRQLAAAGLIEGTYSGLAGAGGATQVASDNVPKSKFGQAYWSVGGISAAVSGHTAIFNYGGGGFTFQLGGLHASAGNRVTVFKPEELWNVDMKMDDGKPGRGKVQARTNEDSYTLADCTTATSGADLDAAYLLSSSAVTCAGVFRHAF